MTYANREAWDGPSPAMAAVLEPFDSERDYDTNRSRWTTARQEGRPLFVWFAGELAGFDRSSAAGAEAMGRRFFGSKAQALAE